MEGSGNHRQSLGRLGEDLACRYLEGLGHTILARNWRSGHLEIDIVSINGDGIHFVEVKARRENIQAPPQESVDFAKQRRIASAAKGFLRNHKGQSYGSGECHFDVIAVTFTERATLLEYIPDAYIPIYL